MTDRGVKLSWQKVLRVLEHYSDRDVAIQFMQKVIHNNPNDVDTYIVMNYLLMNLLVEEDHDESRHDYYEVLIKNYFDESYAKFSDNPKYLFFTGITTYMSEWYFGIECNEAQAMLAKTVELDPKNLLYQWGYHVYSNMSDLNKQLIAIPAAQEILCDRKEITSTFFV